MLVRLLSLFAASCCYTCLKAATWSAINPADSRGRKAEGLLLLESRVRHKQQVCNLLLGTFEDLSRFFCDCCSHLLGGIKSVGTCQEILVRADVKVCIAGASLLFYTISRNAGC